MTVFKTFPIVKGRWVYNKKAFQLIINPSVEELQTFPANGLGARGAILPNGDTILLKEQADGTRPAFIHADIVEILSAVFSINSKAIFSNLENQLNCVPVQCGLKKQTNVYYSESLRLKNNDKEWISAILRKARQLTPELTFVNTHIFVEENQK